MSNFHLLDQSVRMLQAISDEFAKVCFRSYLSKNQESIDHLGKEDIEIIITPIMKDLFTKTKQSKRYVIIGTGKTTTLLWLYHQFKDHSNYQVFALPLELEPITMVYEQLKRNSPTKRILLLCGLNNIQSCNPDVISSLTALHLWVYASQKEL